MKIPIICPLVCGLFALSFFVSAKAESITSDKALKYHELLLNRPGSDVIFTRFYDEWLINASIEELEQFLVQRTKVGGAADWHVLAVFHLQRGEEAKALEAYQSATELAPEDGQLWLSRAESAKALQDHEQALENLDRALSCDLTEPQVLKARRLKGSCLALSGRNKEANTVWQKLLGDFPEDNELMEDLIDLQIGEGMLDEALNTALKLVESTKDPYQKALYQIDVGEIYIRKEERSKARTHLSDLINKVGAGSWLEKEILAQIERLVSGMNDLDAALNFYSELSERYPQRVEIWKRSIQALAASGDVDDAIKQYRELLRLTPGDRQNHEAFIDFLERNERLEQAAENILKLCELYPQDAELRLKHAALLDRLEDRGALLETLESYAALLGDAPNERLQLAKVYDQFGLYEQSGPIYKALAGMNRDDVESVENYAVWLFGRGQEDEAIGLLESLAKEVDREGLIRLSRTLKSEFQGEKAYELLKSRLDDFKTDSLYLLELSNMALSQSVPEEALGWVRTLVLKAESPFELSSAVNLAVSVIQRAEQVDSLLVELDGADDLKLQELSLKAHLENASGDSLSVDAAIDRMRQKGGVIAYSEISRLLEMQGRLDESVKAMEKLIAMEAGRNPLNLRRIVGLLQQLGAWDRAVEYVDEWKALTPGDPKVWLREADLLEAAGRNKEAIRQMRRGLYKFEEDLDLTLRLAALYQAGNEYAEATRIYWRLYNQEEKDSERLRWIRELARVNRVQDKTDQLIDKLSKMREQQRESVFPLLALAEVYRENNYSDLYRKSLVEASSLQPDNPELLRQVASLHETNGDLSAAEEALQRLVRVDSDQANVNTLSGFYLRMGETEKAYDLIFQNKPAGGHTPRDLESIIASLAASGEWEIALEQAEAAVGKFPDDWRLGYLLGICLEANGKDNEAFQRWLSLLGPQPEITDLPKPSQGHHRSYYGDHMQFWQDEASEAAKILQQSARTFSYLNQRSNRPPSYGSGLSGFGMQQISLPMDRESLRSMCALQMAVKASDWPEEKRVEAIQTMRRAGVDSAPLLIALGGARSSQSVPVRLMAYVKENPGDVEALPLLLNFVRRGSFVPEPILQRGYDAYVDEEPAIASEFALALLMREVEESGRYMDYIIDYVSFEDETAMNHSINLLMRLMSLAYGNSNMAKTPALSEVQLTKLQEQVESFYFKEEALNPDPQKAVKVMQSFNVLAMLYAKQGSTRDFISVLEEQLSRLEEVSSTTPGLGFNPYRSHSGRRNNLQFQMPGFEQSYLELSNTMITRFLAKPGSMNRGYPGMMLGEEGRLDLDLASHVDLFTKPELKILVYWMKDDLEGCERMFKQLVNDDPEPHHLYVYATWLLDIKKDKEAAVRALERVLKHPDARNFRSRYEQGIVAVVLEMVREENLQAIDQDILQTARSAVLRLRKSVAMQGHQQQFYVEILNELGLDDEAERMMKAQRAGMGSGMNASSLISFSHGSSRSSNPMDRITELASDGKTAAATSGAVREIRRLIQQASSYNPPRLKQVIQRINGVRLVDEVLQRFDPGESNSRRRMETYAMLLGQFDRKDRAREVWSALHRQHPDKPEYQLELVLLQEGENRLPAIRKLTQIDPVYEDELADWIVQKLNYSRQNQDLASWMALFEFVGIYLEELEPETEQYRNLSWAPFYAVNAGSNVYLDNISFEDILRPNRNNRSGNEEIRERRREGFQRIVAGMQRHPQVAQEAFMLRYAYDKADGDSIDEETYETLALEAIDKEAELKPLAVSQIYYSGSSNRWAYVFQGRHHHSSQQLVDEMSPLAYLIQLYQGEPDKGVARLQELREKISEGNPELATVIQDYVELIAMDQAAFIAACKEWCGDLGQNYGGNEYKLSILPYIIQAREVEGGDLLNFIREIQAPMLAQRNSRTLNRLIESIADLVAENYDSDLVEKWFDSVTLEFLGPEKGWQEFISRWGWSNTYYGGNHPSYKIRMLRQFFWHIAKEYRDLSISAVRYTKKHTIGMQSHAINELRNKLQQGFESVDDAINWCESQGLLCSLENFDALIVLDQQVFRNRSGAATPGQIPLLPQNRNALVYEYALSRISFIDDEGKEKRKAFIEELKQQEFGGIFLAAMLEGRSGKKTAMGALEGKIETVRNMTEREQAELAFLYQYWLKDNVADKEENPALHLAQSRLTQSLEQEVNAYLEESAPVDRHQIHQERQKVEKWLSHLLADDVATGIKLYRKWVERSDRAARSNRNYSANQMMNNNRSVIQSALRPFRNSGEGLEPSIRFIGAILDNDLGDSFGSFYYMTRQIRDGWREVFNDREKAAAKSGTKKHTGFVPGLLSEYDALWETEMEAQFAALTLWSFATERMRISDEERGDLLAWASDLTPEAPLSHRAFAAAITALAMADGLEPEAGAESIATLFGSDGMSLEIRIAFWRSFASGRADDLLEEDASLKRLYALTISQFLKAGYEPLRRDFLSSLSQLASLEVPVENREVFQACYAALLDQAPKTFSRRDQNEMKKYYDSMARIALKMGDIDAAKNLLNRHHWAVEDNTVLFVEMVRAKEFSSALRLMPDAFNADLDNSIRYDAALHESLPAFLEEVLNEKLRYRIKAALMLVRDEDGLEEAGIPERKERVQTLIAELEPKDSRLTPEILNEIANNSSEKEVVIEHIKKFVGDMDLRTTIQHANDHSFGRREAARTELELLEKLLEYETESGEVRELAKQVSSVEDDMSDRYVQRYYKTLQKQFDAYLKIALARDEEKALVAAAPVAESLANMAYSEKSTGRKLGPYFSYLITRLADPSVLGASAREKLSEATLERIQALENKWDRPEEVFSLVDELAGSGSGDPSEARRQKIIRLMLADEAYIETVWLTSADALFQSLGYSSRDEREDIIAVVPQVLSKTHPREPWLAMVLAEAYSEENDEIGKKRKWLAHTIEASKRHPDLKDVSSVATLRLAKISLNVDKDAEAALGYLEKVNLDSLSKKMKVEAELLKEQASSMMTPH